MDLVIKTTQTAPHPNPALRSLGNPDGLPRKAREDKDCAGAEADDDTRALGEVDASLRLMSLW